VLTSPSSPKTRSADRCLKRLTALQRGAVDGAALRRIEAAQFLVDLARGFVVTV
jgi:hypothetical protein